MDYKTWKPKRLSVKSLLLDPANPRLPSAGQGLTQAQILAELIRHDKVYELARLIADRGYFPTEVLAAVQENGQTVVVEGNRRLAALKLLNDPSLAPDPDRAKFKRLTLKVQKDQISKVPVIVSPSREETVPLILGRHTPEGGVLGWKPPMQAQYVRSLLAAGTSREELESTYGISSAAASEAVFNASIYDIASNLESLDPTVQERVANPRTFNLTNLERVLRFREGQDFFGIEIDPEVGLRGRISKSEFEKGFRRLVSDVAMEKISSRDINSGADVKAYLAKYSKEERPNTRVKGRFTHRDFAGDAPEPQPDPPGPKASTPPRTPQSILPSALKCRITDARIVELFRELRRLRVADHPNATMFVLRTLLELAVSRFLAQRGEIDEIRKEIEAKQASKLPRNWHPELRQMLTRAMESADMTLDGQQRRAITKLVNDRDTPLSLDSMNGFVHSPWETPTEREMRGIMTRLEPMLAILLAE